MLRHADELYKLTLELNARNKFGIIRKDSFERSRNGGKKVEGHKDFTVDPSTRYHLQPSPTRVQASVQGGPAPG